MNIKRITHLLMAIVIIATVFYTLTISTSADDEYIPEYINGYINGIVVELKSLPSEDSEILGKYIFGDSVIIAEEADGWSKVLYYESYGYVASENITVGEFPVIEKVSSPYSEPYNFVIEHAYDGSRAAAAIAIESANYFGLPYIYGGTTTRGFDCSGFVQYVYKKHGYSLGRTAHDQMNQGIYVSYENLQPGDIVGFRSGGYWSHVGIYIGDGMFIHSPRSGKTICLDSLSASYYSARYGGARRIITE